MTDDTTGINKTDKAIFTYEEVGNVRVSDGDQVKAGDEVGKVTTNGYQVIQYQNWRKKRQRIRKKSGHQSIQALLSICHVQSDNLSHYYT